MRWFIMCCVAGSLMNSANAADLGSPVPLPVRQEQAAKSFSAPDPVPPPSSCISPPMPRYVWVRGLGWALIQDQPTLACSPAGCVWRSSW
jgi:hypothetical protein